MRAEWNHAQLVEEIDIVMGNNKHKRGMPRDRLHLCARLRKVLSDEIGAVEFPTLKLEDDLLEAVLRSVVESDPGDERLRAAGELLGFTELSPDEIQAVLPAGKHPELPPQEKRKGYRSKAVRQYLAGHHMKPPIDVRRVRQLQESEFASAVANALHGFLNNRPDEVRSIAIRLGILKETPSNETASSPPVPELRNKGDLKVSAGVANVTRGDTSYAKEVTAWVDDVVKIQMTYESAAAVKALRDFVPHIQLPRERGREHRIVVAGTAARGRHVAEAIVTVRSTIPAMLIYVPGSAKVRRNIALSGEEPAHGTEQLDDSIIGPHPLPVDNVLPGREHRATITILARVVAEEVSIRLIGMSDLTKTWRQDIAARPEGIVQLRFVIRNCGNWPLKSMFVYCNLPEVGTLISGSVSLTRGDDVVEPLSDDLIRPSDPTGRARHHEAEDGLNVGTLPIGETVNVDCEIRIEKNVKVGSIVTVVGVVRPLGMNEFYNTVKIAVQR